MLSGLLAQTQPKPQLAHETITRLCDRLLHSTFLEDRRAAILGLKGFTRKYREAVAAGGLKGLIFALQKDNGDVETCRATLETLLLLFIKNEPSEVDEERSRNKQYQSPLLSRQKTDDFIALWLTDEFTQNEEMVFTLIGFVKMSDFYVKLYSLQLLSALITNRPARTQECILAAPLGISSLVSAMDDVRDVIRNEAILVLQNLVADHADVQKLVAFEGAFDKLFNVIDLEGGLPDRVVVGDSLKLMALLLRYNVSNQNHFRETNCVQRLSDLLILPVDKDGVPEYVWDDSLQSNLSLVLEICRLFVPPGHWATPVNQEALCKHGILLNILRLAFGPSTTIPIRSAALCTAADLVRVNQVLQTQLLAIDVPYVDLSIAVSVQKQPQIIPVATALLNWALLTTSIHVFELRLGAQHCLSAVFEGNHDAKLNFINEQIATFKGEPTLSEDPSEGSSTSETLTSLADMANLIAVLVEYDPDALLNPYKTWFACVILMHIFEDALDIRDQVAAIKIGDASLGEEVMSSIQAMSSTMVTSLKYNEPRISIGYLMLLSFWLYEDLNAVNEFLTESSTIQSLIWLITRSGNNNSLVVSLAAILLGITYDFSSKDSPYPRAELHKLLIGTVGRDQYALKVQRLREDPYFKDLDFGSFSVNDRDETGLPKLFLEPLYVALIKDNYSRIQKAFDRDPTVEPNYRISLEMYETLQKEHMELERRYEELKETFSNSESQSTEKLQNLNSELVNVKNSLATSSKELQELRKSKSTLDEELDSTKRALESLTLTHKKLVESNKESAEALQQLKILQEEQIQKEKQLTTHLNNTTKEKEKAETGINKMNRELFNLTKEIEQKENQAKQAQKDLENLQKQFQKSQETEKKLNLTLVESQRSSEFLKKRNRELDEALTAKSNDLEKVNSQLRELQDAYDELDSLRGTLISKLQSAAGQIEAYKSSQSDLRVELGVLKKELSHLEALKNEKRELKQQLDEHHDHLNYQKSEISETNAALETARALIGSLKAELDSLKSALEKYVGLEDNIPTVEETISKLEGDLSGAKENEASNQASNNVDLKEELKGTNARLQKTLTDLEEQLRNLTSGESEDKAVEIAKLKEDLNSANTKSNDRINELESSVSNLSSENGRLNTELDYAKEKVVDMEKSLKTAQSDNREALSKLESSMKAALEKSSAYAKENKALVSELKKVRKELDETRAMNADEAKESEKTHKADMDDLILMLTELDEKKTKYKRRLAELKEDVSDFEDEEVEDSDEDGD